MSTFSKNVINISTKSKKGPDTINHKLNATERKKENEPRVFIYTYSFPLKETENIEAIPSLERKCGR
jgi:hypothetical protein